MNDMLLSSLANVLNSLILFRHNGTPMNEAEGFLYHEICEQLRVRCKVDRINHQILIDKWQAEQEKVKHPEL